MAFETISLGTQPAGTGGDTARTAFEKVNRNFIAADVLAAAMSQAQFEAISEQNRERYAASGWVGFGNHESGKQVNECKPGLYTVLTAANTLRIGKAGGLGGSEKDYALVHIDGVVFNLTNQFVLTLPSHPTSVLPERMDMYGVESEKVEISAASPNAYQGGLRSVGATVNLFTATDQQKKDFFAQNSNTTFIGADGKIYQWQLYKISFAGTTDGVPSPTEQGYSLNVFGDLWLKAGKNLLYFGNVLRLNNGGYHPSFNPLGSARFVNDTFWYNTATSINSKADCFNTAKLLANSGSIASAKSGRPDGRYYDAIYADGQGGVCRDMRYSAYGVDSVGFAEADQKVKNGTYRGFDPVKFSLVTKTTGAAGSWDYLPRLPAKFISDASIGDTVYVQSQSGTYEKRVVISKDSTNLRVDRAIAYAVDYICILETTKKLSVGGAFLQTDVAGNPSNFLTTPQLVDGWQGSFINDLPDGLKDNFSLSRKYVGSGADILRTSTVNNGASWSSGLITLTSPVLNQTQFDNMPANQVTLYQYKAYAKQTENAVNATVFGGKVGIGNVWEYSGFYSQGWGNLLLESFINKIGVSADSALFFGELGLMYNMLRPTGEHDPSSNRSPIHTPINLTAPTNNSSAIKALNYNVNLNQQAFIQYAYTELKHNGTNWGDDGKQAIVDNQSTKTDLNGNTVLVGTAKLKEPIGWIKNKV